MLKIVNYHHPYTHTNSNSCDERANIANNEGILKDAVSKKKKSSVN